MLGLTQLAFESTGYLFMRRTVEVLWAPRRGICGRLFENLWLHVHVPREVNFDVASILRHHCNHQWFLVPSMSPIFAVATPVVLVNDVATI